MDVKNNVHTVSPTTPTSGKCKCGAIVLIPPGWEKDDLLSCRSTTCRRMIGVERMVCPSRRIYGCHARLSFFQWRAGKCLACSLGLGGQGVPEVACEYCAACGRFFGEDNVGNAELDHHHFQASPKDGPKRGLLCGRCNKAEGLLRDGSGRSGILDDISVSTGNMLRLMEYVLFPPTLSQEVAGKVDQEYFPNQEELDAHLDAIWEVLAELPGFEERLTRAYGLLEQLRRKKK